MKLRHTLAVAALLPAVASANLYFAASIGGASLSGLESAVLDNYSSVDSVDIDNKFAVKLDAGIKLTENFAIEINYTPYANSTAKATGGDSVKINAYSLSLLAVAKKQVSEKFGVFAKAGGSHVHASASLGGGGEHHGTHSNSHRDVAYGAGTEYAVTKHTSVTAEFLSIGTDSNAISRINSVFAGIKYQF